MRVLVTAASRHGATTAIAETITRVLADEGLQAEWRRPEEIETFDGYDAVVLGSAVYVGRWLPAAMELAKAHEAALRQRPVWLFSSGPLGTPDAKPEGDPEGVAELSEAINARAHRIFPGRVDRSQLSLTEKIVVRAVRAPVGDFRDWPAVESWARGIAGQLQRAPAAVAAAPG
jgi:menaquinone-dependent protoporphyrinogen oxidase